MRCRVVSGQLERSKRRRRKRKRLDTNKPLVSQILETANRSSDDDGGGVTKTKIMHKVFLTSAQLKECLMILVYSKCNAVKVISIRHG